MGKLAGQWAFCDMAEGGPGGPHCVWEPTLEVGTVMMPMVWTSARGPWLREECPPFCPHCRVGRLVCGLLEG